MEKRLRKKGFLQSLKWFLVDFGEAVRNGDIFVKLSLLVMGVGYARRRQYAKAFIVTAIQAAFILYTCLFSVQYVTKFDTLGDVQYEKVADYFGAITAELPEGADADAITAALTEAGAKEVIPQDDGSLLVLTASTPKALKGMMKNVEAQGCTIVNSGMRDVSFENDWDHSFKILLFSVVSFVIYALFAVMYMSNMIAVRSLQVRAQNGEHINSFRDDIRELFDGKFHKTLLALPITGILVFTVMPLIVIILVAFTNYNQEHYPPSMLFTWVGMENFRRLFSNSISVTFGYSFKKILSWTLTWAVLATFTNFFAGIGMAMLINNRHTHMKKFWRTCFIIAMAVPQFVSLLVVRNFFANEGIVNSICNSLGITAFFKNLGLVPESLPYIPFLTKAGWAKVMILLINIWIGVPYQLLIATGILMNIPQEQYEAATIDGANKWQQFKSITMPYMFFVMGPSLVSDVVRNINNFNVIYLLQQDVYKTSDMALAASNAKETDLLVTWLFRLTQEYYDYDMASAIGIVVFLISAVLTLIAFNTVVRNNKEEEFS